MWFELSSSLCIIATTCKIRTMMKHKSAITLATLSLCSAAYPLYGQLASPEKHAYADPTKERDKFELADADVNAYRLYNFYQRQADHYMSMPADKLPALLPAHPGLDAGKHGHWGKNNQNNHKDPRWNKVDIGSMHSHVTIGDPKVGTVVKAVNVKLPGGLAACFDVDSLSYRAVWNGWIEFNQIRWGTARGAKIIGKTSFSEKKPTLYKDAKYLGVYRHADKVIFHYKIGDVELLDSPGAENGKFTRTVEVISAGGEASLPKLHGPAVTYGDLKQFTKGTTATWDKTITTNLKEGKPFNDSPYVIDTFEVPYKGPYQSVMQLSSIAFDSEETIYVTTLVGEVWSVKKAKNDPKKLEWKRFASGLHVPFGMHYDKDGLFCLDRGQIYRFHDLNNDGEADYYESYASDFTDEGKSHTHTFGLHRQEDGSFYFTQKEQIMRTSPEGVTKEIAYGTRNGMGIGGSKNYFWTGPQEGNWTPASTIIEVEDGKHYGLPKKGDTKPISAPMTFIPRGIDNSTGGFVEITSDQWGPYKGNHVGLSFGANTQYLILRDDKGPKPQGATIPIPGEFISGPMRGAFHPSDGQLYVVGLDGWGDYSIEDGCLQRVRYTGAEMHQPKGFQVFENGIRVDFPVALDSSSFKEPSNILAQSWEYIFSKGYGSPEYSAKSDVVGHDVVKVPSIQPIEGENAIFVEMPDFEPTMVLYLRMHLKTAAGKDFKADLFASPMYPQPYYSFEGAAPKVDGKKKEVAMRVKDDKSTAKDKRVRTKVIEGAREITVKTISSLKYDTKLITAKPKEAIALTMINEDEYPHNLVIVKTDAKQKVGEASFNFVSNPKSLELNYTPLMKEVLQVVPVIEKGKKVTIYFRAPKAKGDYPFICTFPGHWQIMQGIFRVE